MEVITADTTVKELVAISNDLLIKMEKVAQSFEHHLTIPNEIQLRRRSIQRFINQVELGQIAAAPRLARLVTLCTLQIEALVASRVKPRPLYPPAITKGNLAASQQQLEALERSYHKPRRH